ncbi:MAG: ATP-binding protein [Thermomicrobiales bacterium]|nr:ATP-binding protein [Thermomicrobiales bacterium]
MLRPATGPAYLGQIAEATVEEREGPELNLEGDIGLGLDPTVVKVATTSLRLRVSALRGGGAILAAHDAGEWRAPTRDDVFDNAAVAAAEPTAVAAYFDRWAAGRAALEIGRLIGGSEARLATAGFGRHTFLCGQSGSGKTYALGVILERLLLETRLRLAILDPNGDYVRLGDMRSYADLAQGFGASYTPETDAALRARYHAAATDLRVFRAEATGDDAARLRFSELAPEVQAMVLRLDPIRDRDEVHAFRRIVDRLGTTSYTLADVRAAAAAELSADTYQVALRIDNLGVGDWAVWAGADQADLGERATRGVRGAVFDTGGFESPQEGSLLALAVLNTLWRRREERKPILIVIDEAHNICPAEPADDIQAAATARTIQIAGEGRKFGIYLMLATQRPQKLHPNVLSQADNLILMRVNSSADLDRLGEVFSFVPREMLDQSTGFRQGETLLAGSFAPAPMFARIGVRLSPEGGGDVPAGWARQR